MWNWIRMKLGLDILAQSQIAFHNKLELFHKRMDRLEGALGLTTSFSYGMDSLNPEIQNESARIGDEAIRRMLNDPILNPKV